METEDISGGVTVATQTSSLSVVRGREVKRQLEDLEDDDQDDAEVPPSFRRYVALLNRTGPRLVVLSLWISLFVLGVGVYLPLQRLLKVSVEPPYGSDSEAAKATYDKMFPPEPVTLAAMITANGEPGEMLINADATLDYQLFPLPHVSYNPVDDLTALAEVISLDLKDLMKKYLDRCDFDFYSFFDMCAGRTVCPETELQSFTHQLFFPERYGGSEGMILVHMKSCDGEAVYKECVFEKQPFCDPVAALSEDWAEYRERRTHDCIETGRSECNVLLQVVSTPYVFEDIILGVEYGMALSTVATMLAFVVLFAMLRNVRQLALVTANILCAITATIALMYPIAAFVMPVVVTAPPMLVAVALAMSIDYSLFLLSRFNQERALGRPHHRALGVALFTAGHTIAVSGATLALCFCTMLALPTSTITSMALGNAIAVCMSVVVTLTLTPTTLLAAPRFYTSSRKYGLSLDDTPFGSPGLAAQAALPSRAAPDAPSKGDVAAAGSSGLPIGAAVGVSDAAAADLAEGAAPQRDVWALLGLRVQRHARLITVLLALVAVPFALALKEFTYVEDLTPLMQTSHPATHAFIKLADTFGQDLTTPVKLLIMAPTQEDGTTLDITGDKAWSIATCHMLQSLAHNVTTALVAQGYNYTMEPRDFVGLMTFSGGCVAEGYNLGPIDIMPFLKLAAQFTMLGDVLTNQGHNATQVYAHCHEDLFSETGNAWMRTLREQLVGAGGEGVGSGGGTLLEWEGQQIGEVFAYGMPLEQMDGAQYTLRRMPVVVLAIAAIICVILGGSFGTALVPLRAVVCITWMLVVAIGASVMVYQLGYLEFLGLEALAPAGGSLFWISPSVALAVLVGLGLDYDIFLMDSVMENWQEGKDGREAVIAALDQAGTIISAAGIIMFLAFGALLASTTPVLNQIGFMLCIGVLIDCFITTKLTIPALMACVPDAANFWPKKRPPPPTAGDIEERGSVSARGSVPCLRRSLTSSARDLLGAAGTAPPSLRNTGGRS